MQTVQHKMTSTISALKKLVSHQKRLWDLHTHTHTHTHTPNILHAHDQNMNQNLYKSHGGIFFFFSDQGWLCLYLFFILFFFWLAAGGEVDHFWVGGTVFRCTGAP